MRVLLQESVQDIHKNSKAQRAFFVFDLQIRNSFERSRGIRIVSC